MNDYAWGLAPQRSSAPLGYLHIDDNESRLKWKRDVRMREYYYLAGNLYRWYKLYNKVPDDNSWVWNWYPDGHVWNVYVAFWGHDVVNEITKEFVDKWIQ